MTVQKIRRQPNLLIATPELTFDLDVGMGNLLSIGINFQQGGMAPVTSTDVISMENEGTFKVSATAPKWESSLRELNDLMTTEIKIIDSRLPDNFFLISHPSFNNVKIEGSNTKMYEDSWRFSSADRAIAFSSGIINTLLPKINPDILWVNDWMLGSVAPVAKALGIKLVATGHNFFTKFSDLDDLVYKGIELRKFDNYDPTKWIWYTNGKFDHMATEINAADDFITVSEGILERVLQGKLDYLSPSVTQAIKNKSYSKHADGRPRVHGYLNPLEKDNSNFLENVEKYGLENHIVWRKNNSETVRKVTGLKEGGRLVVFPNRFYEQKLPQLLIDNAIYLAHMFDLRILFLANGDPRIVKNAGSVAVGSNGMVAYMSYNKKMENLIKSSDNAYGIMTSEYEPCGGPNLNYPLEGILIGAHAIDGLRDTVKQLDILKSVGNGFPYENNNSIGLGYCTSEIAKFASLPENIRYPQLIRIAKETQNQHASAPRAKRLVEEIFLPLYHEKYSTKKK